MRRLRLEELAMLRTVGRVIWVSIAFVLAGTVCAFVLITLGLERFVHEAQDVGLEQIGDGSLDVLVGYWNQALFIGGLASALTIVPGLLMVIVGEVAGIRSAIYYVLAGGAALAAIPLLTSFIGTQTAALPSTTFLQIFATAGFAGGLIYWLLAGRQA